ncbi:MAG: SDR family NAD(P)-dependent oxidoreductase [Bacteroidales bacterium]|nr:SDR family NAD(P)-dependent oxidoreductase [Bacteroidales bacterium]
MRKSTFKRILITGASSGIGYDTAKALAIAGYEVFAAARRVELMEPLREFGVKPVHLDVTSQESIAECLTAVGKVDVLVNNAGYGYFGAIENVPLEEARRQLEVNLFGLAALCRAVLPGMRSRGCGRIINVSSVAGRGVMYFGGWYHVSKYAVEAFSDALRIEMKPLGVDVVLIEPGGIHTDWGVIAADHLHESSVGTPYEEPGLNQARIMKWAYTRRFLSEPVVVQRAICRAVKARRPRTRYIVGFGARALLLAHALLPTRWWDALARLGGKPIIREG